MSFEITFRPTHGAALIVFYRFGVCSVSLDSSTGTRYMEQYVILLRGVTPTGQNKVLMEPLRAALANAGFEAVRTYI